MSDLKMENTLDLLVFAAHPDDAEIGMGGTMALHAKNGRKVGLCDLTQAELSSNGTVAIRQEEASLASKTLQLTMRENLGFPDRGLRPTDEKVAKLVDVIRQHRPSVVFAPYYEDRHPDHGHCSHLVEEAVFSAGVKKVEGECGLPAHRVTDFYFYFINGFHYPDFVVDIGGVQSIKMDALRAYRSQFIKEDSAVETPLTTGYLETVESRDRLFGKEAGITFAEGFKTKRPMIKTLLL